MPRPWDVKEVRYETSCNNLPSEGMRCSRASDELEIQNIKTNTIKTLEIFPGIFILSPERIF